MFGVKLTLWQLKKVLTLYLHTTFAVLLLSHDLPVSVFCIASPPFTTRLPWPDEMVKCPSDVHFKILAEVIGHLGTFQHFYGWMDRWIDCFWILWILTLFSSTVLFMIFFFLFLNIIQINISVFVRVWEFCTIKVRDI